MCRIAAVLFAAAICAMPICAAFAEPGDNAVDLSQTKGAVITELSSLTPIMGKEADTKYNVAGLARLPILLYICEAIDAGHFSLTDEVTISEAAAAMTGPTAFVEPYERIGAQALLKAGIMILAGDAVYALAETVGGTGGAALSAINARLKALSVDVEYMSLTAEGIRLSANDLVRIGAALAKSETFTAYSATYMDEIIHEGGRRTELVNQNRLIRNVTGCFGMATGSSADAGYCGLFSVRRGDSAYLCAVIGAPNSSSRFSTAQEMIEYSFTAFKATALVRAGEVIAESVPVHGGSPDRVNIVAGGDAVLLLRQGESYERSIALPEELFAPLQANEPVGKVRFTGPDGTAVVEIELFPQTNVAAATLWEHVQRVFVSWLHA